MAPFLDIQGLSRRFSAQSGVHEISLGIQRGQFVVLLGPSGCGKSTTLRLIAGLETPDTGCIAIDGRDVTALSPSERGLSMVFQSYALFPHLTVAENILFGLKVRRVARDERARRLDRALGITGLHGFEGRKPAQLSGGQRQRVALARAIVADHPLCLMDEPLSNLDAQLRHSVRQDIRELQKQLGMTVIYVTHDQTEAMSMADVVVLMNNGRVEQAASPGEIYARPATEFAARFIGSPPMTLLPGHLLIDNAETSLSADLLFGVRAENLVICSHDQGRLSGPIIDQEFMGAETYVHLDVPGGHRLTARIAGQSPMSVGERVGVTWPHDAAHWFCRQSGKRISPPPCFHRPAGPSTSRSFSSERSLT